MEDSYKILGVPWDASDDDVKKAYRSLSRRYHPDSNVGNPDKTSCEMRFVQVQQAYTRIMKERSMSCQGDNIRPPYSRDSEHTDIRNQNGNEHRQEDFRKDEDSYLNTAAEHIYHCCYEDAFNILNRISERTARWYYYSAAANQGCGNNITALDHAQTAVRMDPGNPEYQRLVNRLKSAGGLYRQRQHPSDGTLSAGNLCLALCTAETLCSMCISSGLCSGGGN